MNPLLTLRIALRALLRNKMRSFLTTLGIIIGVSAVIAMVAIGEGAKAQVEKQFAAMGTSLLIVMPGASSSGGARVEVAGGLVGEDQLGARDQRAGDGHPLLLAARKLARVVIEPRSESHLLERFTGAAHALFGAHARIDER